MNLSMVILILLGMRSTQASYITPPTDYDARSTDDLFQIEWINKPSNQLVQITFNKYLVNPLYPKAADIISESRVVGLLMIHSQS
jgi:hypothetical protein